MTAVLDSTRLIGSAVPRLSTEPLRRLTPATSRGFEVIAFAKYVLRKPLLPWQENLVVRALEIDPDGSYRFRIIVCLVGRQNGKSHVARVITLWRLFTGDARLALGVAQDLDIARELWAGCLATVHDLPWLAEHLAAERHTNGQQEFSLANAGRYKIAAANRQAGRGLTVDHLNLDELREQRKWDAWAALSKTTMAVANALILAISNAGDDQSVVLNHLRDIALSGKDPSVGLWEWSAPQGCDLDDPRAWTAANPGLGHTVQAHAIRTAASTDPPAVFRTEVLCQRVEQLDGAIDLAAWRACSDPGGADLGALRDRVCLCLDVSLDGQHITLAGAAVLDDGRVRVEMIAAWSSVAEARRDLRELAARLGARAGAWFPSGPAAELAPELRALGWRELKGAEVVEACMEFAGLVTGRGLLQDDDPLLTAHVGNAAKVRAGDGWRFTRRGAGHVDAVYAAAGATHVARTLPAERPRSAIY